jgi:hypothetical protein
MSGDLERRLRKLRERVPEPEARLLEQVRASLIAGRGEGAGPSHPRRGRPGGGGLLIAVAALLVGSAVGFGVGQTFDPRSGTAAAAPSYGIGFLPADGWNVVQNGIRSSRSATSIAATVPLESSDLTAGGFPRETVAALPPDGVVISATVYPNGFRPFWQLPRLRLPLHLTDAASEEARPHRAYYRILANVNGQDIDVRIVFGAAVPPATATLESDRQLSRVVVRSAPSVTIDARPTLADRTSFVVTVYGRVSGAPGDDDVRIEAKECGFGPYFHGVAGADPDPDGAWTAQVVPWTKTTYRARWKSDTSGEVVVRYAPRVTLQWTSTGKLQVFVGTQKTIPGRRVAIERFSSSSGTWVKVRMVKLGKIGTGMLQGRIRLNVAKGTLLRATVPESETGACYERGVSNTLRR